MSTRQLLKRIEKVHGRMFPKRNDGTFTLEELCRAIWREDENQFRKMTSSADCRLRHFIPQFEREDLLDGRRSSQALGSCRR